MLLLLVACTTPDPTADLPSDGFLAASGAALADVAGCISGFPDSPAADVAKAWRALGESCPGEVYGVGANAAMNLHCGAAPEAVQQLRAQSEVAFGFPRGESGVITARATRTSAGLWSGEARVPAKNATGILGLVTPSPDSPGPNVLSHAGAVIHGRVRTASGIDIGALVPEGTQGDQLFNLKSALLSRAVLDGSWELAAYPPPTGQIMPEPVLALGVHAAAAGPAVASFAGQLREKWSVQRVPTSVGGWNGECIKGIRVLPGLEPCWVMSDANLVIGWNQAALGLAVGGPIAPLDTGHKSGLVVDFASLAAADAVLAAGLDPTVLAAPLAYPPGQVVAALGKEGDSLLLSLNLTGKCRP